MCKYELPTSRLSEVIADRQTDREIRPKLYTTPLRGWSMMLVGTLGAYTSHHRAMVAVDAADNIRTYGIPASDY